MVDLLTQYDRAMNSYKLISEEKQQRHADQEAGKSLARSVFNPQERYEDELAKAQDLFDKKIIHEETLGRLKKQYLEDYYRQADDLDADRINKAAKSDIQMYNKRLGTLMDMNQAGLITGEAFEKELDRSTKTIRRGLGISDPMGDYRESLKDLNEALGSHVINEDEFEIRRKELRQRAERESKSNNEMLQNDLLRPTEGRVHAVGAMERGSMEAHAILAESMIRAGDPKVDLQIAQQKETNTILNRIDAEIRVPGNRLVKK